MFNTLARRKSRTTKMKTPPKIQVLLECMVRQYSIQHRQLMTAKKLIFAKEPTKSVENTKHNLKNLLDGIQNDVNSLKKLKNHFVKYYASRINYQSHWT